MDFGKLVARAKGAIPQGLELLASAKSAIETGATVVQGVKEGAARLLEEQLAQGFPISESNLNQLLKRQVGEQPGLKTLHLKLREGNLVEIEAVVQKLGTEAKVSASVYLEDFRWKSGEGEMRLRLAGPIDLVGQNWLGRFVLCFASGLIQETFRRKLSAQMNPDVVVVEGDLYRVNLSGIKFDLTEQLTPHLPESLSSHWSVGYAQGLIDTLEIISAVTEPEGLRIFVQKTTTPIP